MNEQQREVAATLLSADTVTDQCPTRALLDQVTTRWATLILAALTAGPHRFSALSVAVGGISQKMLAQNLKVLVRAGLVHREVLATVPPQVTYSLTELGDGLAGQLYAVIHWFGQHAEQLLDAQQRHDEAAVQRETTRVA